jgi:hypothetical protein
LPAEESKKRLRVLANKMDTDKVSALDWIGWIFEKFNCIT